MNTPAERRENVPITARLIFALACFFGKTPMRGATSACLNHLKAKRHRIQGLDVARASLKAKAGNFSEAIEMLKEELRLFPGNSDAALLLKEIQMQSQGTDIAGDKRFDEEFEWLYSKVSPYTMVGAERLFALYSGAKSQCVNNVAGNFAECGVAGGGSSALLAYVIKHHSKSQRTLFAFDTFEGLPSPGAEDVRRGVSAAQAGWGEGTCAAPVSCLREIAEDLGVWDRIITVQGLFQDTLAPTRGRLGQIALLHMDGDWYDSTKTILDNFYDQIAPHGYVQVDDYGYWEGCKKAVDEFEKSRGLNLSKRPIDSCGISFNKAS